MTHNDLKMYDNCKKTLQYNVKGKPKIVHYWLAELINPNASVKLSDEHQDFKWLGLEEACELAGYKEMQETLREFSNFINKL